MKALIIDDEPLPAKRLKSMLKRHIHALVSIDIITSPRMAVDNLKDHVYDLLFLDVEMPGLDGFGLLKEVELPDTTQVIFVTAFSQYAIEAFDANAVHYMLKPVTKDGVIRAVQKASRNLQPLAQPTIRTEGVKAAMISVFDGEQYLILNEADIIRLEADGSYTTIVSDKHGRILASKGLLHFAEKLNNSLFFRCHISHIVNIRQICKISKGRSGYVTLLNNEVVPVSKSRKAQLHQLMGL